jgi:hypothetical protein
MPQAATVKSLPASFRIDEGPAPAKPWSSCVLLEGGMDQLIDQHLERMAAL